MGGVYDYNNYQLGLIMMEEFCKWLLIIIFGAMIWMAVTNYELITKKTICLDGVSYWVITINGKPTTAQVYDRHQLVVLCE